MFLHWLTFSKNVNQDFNMLKKIVIFIFLCVLFRVSVNAQEVNANLHLDKNKITVGDQVKLTISVTSPKDYLVNFPVFKDSLLSGVEIVNIAPVDSVFSQDKKTRTLNQVYTITAFDSGFYYIKSFDIQYKKPKDPGFSSLLSDSISLTVHTIPVDTTKAIKDIKEPLGAPLTLIEILQYLGMLLGLILIVLAIIYVIYKVRRKEPLIKFPEKPKPPAHVIALETLEALKNKKLWQTGFIKEYHSELTDIVRTYIEKRFLVNAMEMVTDEIMEALIGISLDKENLENLKAILQLADIVKFAKGTPLPAENERSFNDAVSFVKSTIPVEIKPEEEKEKTNLENQNKQ